MAKKLAQYQIDLQVIASSKSDLETIQKGISSTDKLLRDLNNTGLRVFTDIAAEVEKIPQALAKADRALEVSTQKLTKLFKTNKFIDFEGSIYNKPVPGTTRIYDTREVPIKGTKKAIAEATASMPNTNLLSGLNVKQGIAEDFNKITKNVSDNIQKLGILKNVLKEVRENYKNATGEAKQYWGYVEKNVSAQIGKIQNALHGGERGFRDVRSFFKDIKDLATWQMRWYGAKALLFVPFEKVGQTAKEFVGWQQAMTDVKAASTASADEMKKLEDVTIRVGNITPVSAKKSAKAMFEFAQAGVDVLTIEQAMPVAAKLVTITHEDMGSAVTALTKIYNVYSEDAKNMVSVGDRLAASMADSRLKVQDLATIFNYLGPQAKLAKVSLTDLLTVATALSQAGAEPSTLATGMSTFMASLTNPTPKLRASLEPKLKDIGKSMADVKMPENNIINVIKLLKEANVNVADLFAGLQMRAGRSAASLNLMADSLDRIKQNLTVPGKLDSMWKISMEGLENRFEVMLNKITNLGIVIGRDLMPSIEVLVKGLEKVVGFVTQLKDVFILLFDVIASRLIAMGIMALIPALGKLFTHFKIIWTVLASSGGLIAAVKTFFSALAATAAGLTGWGILVGTLLFTLQKFLAALKELEALRKDATAGIAVNFQGRSEQFMETYIEGIRKDLKKAEDAGNTLAAESLRSTLGMALAERARVRKAGKEQEFKRTEKASGKGMLGQRIALDKKDRNEDINLQKAYLSLQDAIWESSYKLGLMSATDYFKKREEIARESYSIMIKDAKDYLAEFTKKDSKIYSEYQQQLADAEKIEDVKERAEKKAYIEEQFRVAKKEAARKVATLEIEESKRILKATQEMLEKEKEVYIKHQNTLLEIQQIRLEKEIEAENAKLERTSILNEYAYSKNKLSAEVYYNQEAIKLNIERLNSIKKAEEEYYSNKQKAAQDFLFMETNDYAVMSEENYKQYNAIALKLAEARNKAIQGINDKYETNYLQLQIKRAEDIKNVYGTEGAFGVIGKSFSDIGSLWGNMAQNIADTSANIANSMKESFADFFDFMSDGFMDFENLAKKVLHDIYMEVLKNVVLKQVFSGLFSVFNPPTLSNIIPSSGVGESFTSVFSSFGSNFSFLTPRASGGPVSLNKAYIVGENGPELFKPATNGTIIPNNKLADISSPPTLIVNVENKTGKQVKATQSQPQFDGKKWVRTVLLELADSDMTVRQRYGVR